MKASIMDHLHVQNVSRERLVKNLSLRKMFIYKHFLRKPQSVPLALLLLRFPSESHLNRMSYERLLRWERRMSRIEDNL